jgi:ABC-type enterochelin transport system permease subunit
MNLIYGLLWGLFAQIITFLQLQGQIKYDILKNNTWFLVLMGLPISYMFMQSVKNFVLAFDGEIWPSRLLGFGLGVIVFSIMSSLLFKEPFTAKTGTCLFLGLCIILIQLFWKN